MSWTILRHILLAIILLAILAVSGCTQAGPRPSRDAIDVADVTAERMLQSLNTGDYEAFTANFSAPMIRAVNETMFNDIRKWVRDRYGDYISKSESSAYAIQSYNNFEYSCKFSKGNVVFRLTMNQTNISMVEGEHFL
jgi:hypothetical protein